MDIAFVRKILIGVFLFPFAFGAYGNDEAPPEPARAAAPRVPVRPAPMAGGAASRAASKVIVNPGFEDAGAAPLRIPGWTLSQHAGVRAYEMDVDKSVAAEGHASFRMHRTQPQMYGMIAQTIDVAALAGKKVELRVRAKVDGVGKEGWMVFLDSSGSRASTKASGTSDWKELSVTMQLPKSAKVATLGAMLLDGGTAWLDDVRLKPL